MRLKSAGAERENSAHCHQLRGSVLINAGVVIVTCRTRLFFFMFFCYTPLFVFWGGRLFLLPETHALVWLQNATKLSCTLGAGTSSAQRHPPKGHPQILRFFYADFGKDFLPELCGNVLPEPAPLQALCCALCSTE